MGKKLLSIAVNALCALAILVSLLCAWAVVTTPTGNVPSIFGHSMLTVLTGSMEPSLPKRSLIFVKKVAPSSVEEGDIITFYTTISGYQGVVNTHRVTEVVEQNGVSAFRTKGDANPIEDTTVVSAGQLVGKVVGCSALLGVFVSFLQKPFVFLPLVLIPLFVLIIRSALRLARLAKEEFRRAEEEVRKEYHDSDDDQTGS